MLKDSQQLVSDALKIIKEISVSDLHQLQQSNKVNIIDVREESEVKDGVIQGSIWMPRGLLEFQISSLSQQLGWQESDPIYICCRSGNRSALAAVSLLGMGYAQPISVAGGFIAWQEAGLLVSKDILHF